MRIGLCGAHRTGKSTLAATVAERTGLFFNDQGVVNTVKKTGFNMATDSRITPGLPLQSQIMDGLLERLVGDDFVSDRTPIDAAAYLLADATAGAGDAATHEEVLQYMDKAVRETFRRFDLLVLIPPALSVEAHPDKPPVNAAYQMHHHLLCRSMLLEREEWLATAVELPVDVLDLTERAIFVEAHIKEAALNRMFRMATKTTVIY